MKCFSTPSMTREWLPFKPLIRSVQLKQPQSAFGQVGSGAKAVAQMAFKVHRALNQF